MWGWNTSRKTAFALLDQWYGAGFRQVDAATNYPIDKNPDHFRLSEKILLEWIKVNNISDLRIIMKIGSVNNLFSPEHILTPSFILMMLDEYQHLFGQNLDTLMVHWDNRHEKEPVLETLEALSVANRKGLKPGLSGIKYPAVYFELNKKTRLDFRIQIKHNVLHSDYARYAPFHGRRRFIAYGINAGGLKLDARQYSPHGTLKTRGGNVENQSPVLKKIKNKIEEFNAKSGLPPVTQFYQTGLINAFYKKYMESIIVGAANEQQLADNIAFYHLLQKADYSGLFAGPDINQ